MALKGMYARQEDIPDLLREHAVEHNGQWVLEVEGYASKPIIDEMRANNRTMRTENETLKADLAKAQGAFGEFQKKFEGIDPEEYKILKAAPTDVQKEIAAAEKRWHARLEEQVGAERKLREAAELKFQQEQIGNEVAKYAPKAGAEDTAIEDIQRRAIGHFRIVDGKPVAFDGDTPLYSEKEPSKLLTITEWVDKTLIDFPHYAKRSSGAGVGGGIQRGLNGRPVIPASDNKAFIQNLERIAKGEIEVDISA
jgi:hypothetical protein